MEQQQLSWITNFIWGIADDILRDVYVEGWTSPDWLRNKEHQSQQKT